MPMIVFCKRVLWTAVAVVWSFSSAGAVDISRLPPPLGRQVDFLQEVQPLLEKSCYACHGEKMQRGDLRWDVKALALKGGTHGAALIPGQSAESRMIHLVAGLVPDEIMPAKGERLTAEQISLLRAWIDQGAVWPDGVDKAKWTDPKNHWAFQAPVRSPLPAVKNKKWARNPIDLYILAKLEKEKLRPAARAEKITLLRRWHLDLIGLPPTPAEADAFLADKSPEADAKLIERLLASPHYGERWGRHWLDAARFADTKGYEKDLPRNIWPYRDWVINALNRDLPYDQFVMQQLAGDLLPDATTETRVATGFLRNSMLNEEGGIDPEQFRIEGIIDRIDAIGKSFLGLTIACAQCHNHKFDPISQKEYYQIFAFLNNDDEPEMEVPNAEQQTKRAAIKKKIAQIEDEWRQQQEGLAVKLAEWEQRMRDIDYAWKVLDPEKFYGSVGTKFSKEKDKSLLTTGSNPPVSAYTVSAKTDATNITGFRLEVLADPNLPGFGPGRAPNGNFVLTEFEVYAAPVSDPTKTNRIVLTNATADFSQAGFPVSGAIDGVLTNKLGWAGEDLPGRRNRDRSAVFEAQEGAGFAGGTILTFVLKQVYGAEHAMGRFRLSVITDRRSLEADPLSKTQRSWLACPAEQRTPEQQRELFSVYRLSDPRCAETNKKIDEEQKKWPTVAKTLVLQEKEVPRETRIFKRGDFKKPLEQVFPNTPAVLPPLGENWNETTNRLAFAQWLVAKKNPLTARVIVNRVWQAYFGQGLVATPEDFGTRCAGASHPELLDWLACEFMEQGWSLKALHRLILNSATYRQSSKVSPENYAADQYNLWLGRGARFRVEAEIVRDIALQASGLLNEKIGGPSVYPEIPDGVMSLAYGSPKWPTSAGADKYRRGLYIYWKRTVNYPSLALFDAPNADASCVRRVRSNTPLQALTTLNDATFHECSQALARRVWQEGGTDDAARAIFAFRLCTGRFPDPVELKALLALLRDQQNYFANRTDKAIAVAVSDPKQLPENVNLHAVAAWTMVARVLLNMDETMTKE